MYVTGQGPFLFHALSYASPTFSPVFTLDQASDVFELVLLRSGAVRGRILASGAASFDGLSLWIAPTSLWNAEGKLAMDIQCAERTGRSLDECRTRLGRDASFLLERLPPGPSLAFLVINEAVATGFNASPEGVRGTVRLGEVEVPSGETLDRDFTATELPGWIEFDLFVNGQPAPSTGVTLLGPMSVEGLTDDQGHFGPKRVLAGTWSVSARNRKAGWEGRVPGTIVVEPGERAKTVLDAPVARGAVMLVDAEGRPIAS